MGCTHAIIIVIIINYYNHYCNYYITHGLYACNCMHTHMHAYLSVDIAGSAPMQADLCDGVSSACLYIRPCSCPCLHLCARLRTLSVPMPANVQADLAAESAARSRLEQQCRELSARADDSVSCDSARSHIGVGAGDPPPDGTPPLGAPVTYPESQWV